MPEGVQEAGRPGEGESPCEVWVVCSAPHLCTPAGRGGQMGAPPGKRGNLVRGRPCTQQCTAPQGTFAQQSTMLRIAVRYSRPLHCSKIGCKAVLSVCGMLQMAQAAQDSGKQQRAHALCIQTSPRYNFPLKTSSWCTTAEESWLTGRETSCRRCMT